jgi:acyl carrier protein
VGLFDKSRSKKKEKPSVPTEPLTEESIQQWLVARIAGIARVDPQTIDLNQPFAEFGLDSLQLFELSGDLHNDLGYQVSDIIAWDYPTIAKLSRHLSNPGTEVPASAKLAVGEGSW